MSSSGLEAREIVRYTQISWFRGMQLWGDRHFFITISYTPITDIPLTEMNVLLIGCSEAYDVASGDSASLSHSHRSVL
jgi:hypothetical protein